MQLLFLTIIKLVIKTSNLFRRWLYCFDVHMQSILKISKRKEKNISFMKLVKILKWHYYLRLD